MISHCFQDDRQRKRCKISGRMSRLQERSFAERKTTLAGFTLVEILVVMSIMVALAAVALPATKELLSKQKVTRAASGLQAFIDSARNRAIAGNRSVGVVIERFNPTTDYGRASSIRLRLMIGVPPYSGDADNAVAHLRASTSNNPSSIIAEFDPADSQLLALSVMMNADGDPNPPIRVGDQIELPGGRRASIIEMDRGANANGLDRVFVRFNLREVDSLNSALFPEASNYLSEDRFVKFKIHRRPVASSTSVFSLPRGVVLDLNYSGVGVYGNQFAPSIALNDPAPDIGIVFGGDGKVINVFHLDQEFETPPTGQIFLCLGESDRLHPENLFAIDDDAPANLLSLDSTWLVINSNTGRSVVSPFASVRSIPTGVVTDPVDASLRQALLEARYFANLGDTVDLP